MKDLAGNQLYTSPFSFTTGVGPADTTSPEVVLITPADGAVYVAVGTPVVVMFSEPLDPSTLGSESVALFVDGTKWGPAIQRSADNTVVTLTTSLPAGSWWGGGHERGT